MSQPYTQGAMNLSGPQPAYNQQFGTPPTSMQQVTNQMAGMQVGSTVPSSAGPGYGKYYLLTQVIFCACGTRPDVTVM